MKERKRMNKKPTKAQKSRSLLSSKAGQEEMVGFGLIIILVAVIFIVFLSVYLRKPGQVTEDYEAGSFIQSVLQYTTTCEDTKGNLSVQDLIIKCKENDLCEYRNMNPCQVLNNTLKTLIRESWETNPDGLIKGYSFVINVSEDQRESEQTIVKIESGVVTNNYIGSEQDFGKSRESLTILFHIYN